MNHFKHINICTFTIDTLYVKLRFCLLKLNCLLPQSSNFSFLVVILRRQNPLISYGCNRQPKTSRSHHRARIMGK